MNRNTRPLSYALLAFTALVPVASPSVAATIYTGNCSPALTSDGAADRRVSTTCSSGSGSTYVSGSSGNFIDTLIQQNTTIADGMFSVGSNNTLTFGSGSSTTMPSSGYGVGSFYGGGNTVLINPGASVISQDGHTFGFTPGSGPLSSSTNTLTNQGLIRNNGSGTATIYNGASTGIYNGASTGYNGASTGGSPANLHIINSGTISNLASSNPTAIEGSGSGQIMLENYGTITGNVLLGSGNDTVTIGPASQLNSYVDAGSGADTLIFGGTSGTGTVDFSAFGSGSSGTYRNFEGFGGSGGATWIFTGNGSTIRSTATISNGGAIMNGTYGGSVVIAHGAFGGGSGSILGSLSNSGTIRPGNSIGTLTVAGNYTQSSSGTLEIEISPTSADKLAVSGAAALGGALVVAPQSGTYTTGTSYEILTAGSGVTGTFSSTTTQNSTRLGNLTATPTYESSRVLLVLSSNEQASASQQQSTTAESAVASSRATVRAVTRTVQARVADIFRSVRLSIGGGPAGRLPAGGGGGSGGRDKAPRAEGPSNEELAVAIGAGGSGLGGGDGSGKGVAVWTDTSLALLDDPEGTSRYSGWLSVTTLGADTKLLDDRLVVGTAIGIDYSDLTLKGVDGALAAVAGTVSAYAGYQISEMVTVDGLVGYGRANNEGRQRVSGALVTGDYASNRYFGGANVTARTPVELNAGPVKTVDVAGTLGYSHSLEAFDPYTSSDAARVALRSVHLGTTRLAGEVSTVIDEQFVPYLTLGVEHDVLNHKGGSKRTGGFAGAGLTATLENGINLGTVFNANFGRGEESEYQFGANLRYSF